MFLHLSVSYSGHEGGMCGKEGACVAKMRPCVAKGGMYGEVGHAWQRGCAWRRGGGGVHGERTPIPT